MRHCVEPGLDTQSIEGEGERVNEGIVLGGDTEPTRSKHVLKRQASIRMSRMRQQFYSELETETSEQSRTSSGRQLKRSMTERVVRRPARDRSADSGLSSPGSYLSQEEGTYFGEQHKLTRYTSVDHMESSKHRLYRSICDLQAEAQQVQHLVSDLTSTQTMRRRRTQTDGLSIRARRERAAESISSYVPIAPRESGWGHKFDEMISRLRGCEVSVDETEQNDITSASDNRVSETERSDSTVDTKANDIQVHNNRADDNLTDENRVIDNRTDENRVTDNRTDENRVTFNRTDDTQVTLDESADLDLASDSLDELNTLNISESDLVDDETREKLNTAMLESSIGPNTEAIDSTHESVHLLTNSLSQSAPVEESHAVSCETIPSLNSSQHFVSESLSDVQDENVSKLNKGIQQTDSLNNITHFIAEPVGTCYDTKSDDLCITSVDYIDSQAENNHVEVVTEDVIHADNAGRAHCSRPVKFVDEPITIEDSRMCRSMSDEVDRRSNWEMKGILRSISYQRPEIATYNIPFGALRRTDSNNDVWIQRPPRDDKQRSCVSLGTNRSSRSLSKTSRWKKFSRIFSFTSKTSS